MEIAGNIIIFAGIIIMAFGVIGIFKFKAFYERMLVSAEIDTAGALTIIIGIAVKSGFGFFSLKLLLIVLLMMIINPLIANTIARSAYLSGLGSDKNAENDMDNS